MKWFSGHVSARWLSDGRSMEIEQRLTYRDGKGRKWFAEKGLIVDGASIPRFFWRFMGGPFSGKYRRASVIHDAYCQSKTVPSKEVHAVFYEMMRFDRVPYVKAVLMWMAVRFFGPRFKGK